MEHNIAKLSNVFISLDFFVMFFVITVGVEYICFFWGVCVDNRNSQSFPTFAYACKQNPLLFKSTHIFHLKRQRLPTKFTGFKTGCFKNQTASVKKVAGKLKTKFREKRHTQKEKERKKKVAGGKRARIQIYISVFENTLHIIHI